MKLSLLDLFGEDEEPADSVTNVQWPIELVGEVRRGWPLHPADADALPRRPHDPTREQGARSQETRAVTPEPRGDGEAALSV